MSESALLFSDPLQYVVDSVYRKYVTIPKDPTLVHVEAREIAPVLRNFRKFRPGKRQLVMPDFPFLKESYRPLHFNDMLDKLSTGSLNSSAGVFYRPYGLYKVRDVINNPMEVRRLRTKIHLIKKGVHDSFPACNVFVARSHLNLETGKVKRRAAWNFPLVVRLAEQMFARPVIDALPDDYILSPGAHGYKYCQLLDSQKLDFASFDASVPYWLLKMAVKELFKRFELTHYACGSKVSARNDLGLLLHTIKRYILRTPYRYKNRLYKKYHGVPSGSAFTNILDSMISRIVVANAHIQASGFGSCVESTATYGDDVVTSCGTCTFESIARWISEATGMKVKKVEYKIGLPFGKRETWFGLGFHPGLWIRNILSMCDRKYMHAVAWQLLQPPFALTPLQRYQMLRFKPRAGRLPRRLEQYIQDLKDKIK